jgi:hypothetical protein
VVGGGGELLFLVIMDVYVLTKNKMALQDSKTRCVLKKSTDIISMIV